MRIYWQIRLKRSKPKLKCIKIKCLSHDPIFPSQLQSVGSTAWCSVNCDLIPANAIPSQRRYRLKTGSLHLITIKVASLLRWHVRWCLLLDAMQSLVRLGFLSSIHSSFGNPLSLTAHSCSLALCRMFWMQQQHAVPAGSWRISDGLLSLDTPLAKRDTLLTRVNKEPWTSRRMTATRRSSGESHHFSM